MFIQNSVTPSVSVFFSFWKKNQLELKCKIWDGEMVQLFRTFVALIEGL